MPENDHTTKSPAAGAEVQGAEGAGLLGLVQRYPVICATILFCTLVGIGIGVGFLPEDWSLARRIAGGAVGGAGCGLIVTAPRIVG
jgi:hypothetical protein